MNAKNNKQPKPVKEIGMEERINSLFRKVYSECTKPEKKNTREEENKLKEVILAHDYKNKTSLEIRRPVSPFLFKRASAIHRVQRDNLV